MDHISREDCLQVLAKCLGKEVLFHLDSFEVVAFHSPLQGLVGEHYTLRTKHEVKGRVQTRQFFVKTLSSNPLLMEFSKSVLVWEKETFFYNLLQEMRESNIDTGYAPEAYFFKPRLVVLQDLTTLGYRGVPKTEMLDLEHCQVCVEGIARFHASSIIYGRRRSEELGRDCWQDHADILADQFQGLGDSMATRWLQTAIKGLFTLIDLVPEGHVSNDRFRDRLVEVLGDETEVPGVLSALLHGDLWMANFLFLYRDGKPSDCKLVDYQMLNYGPVETDLVRFLMLTTSKAFRAAHFEELVERYFEKLQQVLEEAGCGQVVPKKADFVASCNSFKLVSKLYSFIDHSFTFVDDSIVEETLESEETFRRYLLEERGQFVERSFRTNETYRQRLTEDAEEMRELLFPQI